MTASTKVVASDDDVDLDLSSTDRTEPAETEAELADTEAQRVPRWQPIAAAVIAVLIVAGAVVAGLLGKDAVDRNHVQARNAEAVETARQVVTELTTLQHNSLTTTVNSVLAHTTGAFRNQFADSSDAFKSALTDGKVDSTGRIDSAGLIRGDGNTAEVLIAASSTVKNSQAPNGDPRVYRMKVTLQYDADKWLVSNVEFVA